MIDGSLLAVLVVVVLLVEPVALWMLIKRRNMDIWLPAHIRDRNRARAAGPVRHVYFCIGDHYEPYGGGVDRERARSRARRWFDDYPRLAGRFTDSDGRHPQHSFFYPEEEYDESILEGLAGLCRNGFGDVEIHLHHDNDTAESLKEKLTRFKNTLHERHGLLRREDGDIRYAFIHGNWALDNSRPDGRWCGVDNELTALTDTGCYMDMTMPSAPSDTQTRIINSIYFARGEPGKRKSHDKGRRLCRGGGWAESGDLLMVQGPLTLDWTNRKLGLIPRIEAGELSMDAPPRPHRIDLWADCRVCVEGAEEHVFIKTHTHGAEDDTIEMFFDQGGFEVLWSSLIERFRDVDGCRLHFVTARQMYETVRDLEGSWQDTGDTEVFKVAGHG